MSGKDSRRNNRIRMEVAAEAARIMATEGQRSFLAAKEKAANRMGLSSRGGLPSNTEVEQALKAWQGLYGGDSHEENLRELRRAALDAMEFLSEFRPRLVGPVLEGTADVHSRISLHVFADDPDAVVRFLMDRRVPYEQESRRIRWHDGSARDLEIVVLQGGGHVIELLLMIGADARQAPPSPVDGRSQRRMGSGELRRLMETE